MKINYYLPVFFLLVFCYGFAQSTFLCPQIEHSLTINDAANVPTVIDNGNATITLMLPEQYMTDIFANRIIYDFYQCFPSSKPNGELIKYYIITFQIKNLINK